MYGTIADLPDNIQADYTTDEQGAYLRVFNAVYGQTQDQLKAHLAAMGAIKKLRITGVQVMRRAENGDPVVGGWAMYFSNSSADTDSYDTHFATLTKLMLDYYQRAPLWWEHGLDNDYGVDPIGRRYVTQIYRHGVFLEHNLHQKHFRFGNTTTAVDNGEVCYSSDSIAHYVEQGFNQVNGRVDVWPMAGCSLTRNPAELALGPVVSMRSYATALRSLLPLKPEAREAQRGRSFYFVQMQSLKGAQSTMSPEQLAALAEFLGCEATPEAVAQALMQLLSQLQSADATATPPPEQQAMMTQIAPALGLPATAGRSEIVGKLEAILAMVKDAPKGKKLKVDALRRFTELAQDELDDEPEEDDIPHYTRDEDEEEDERPARRSARETGRDRQVGFRHLRGAKKPGLLDVIGAITQVQGGTLTFEMPAFKSRRVSARQAMRAMNINSGQNGGWTLNREMSDELLEALYAKLIFDRLGVTVVPMTGIESLTMNRVKSGATAYWAGADQTTTDSGNTKIEAAVTLNLRELVCEYPVQNRLLANSSMQLEAMIEKDIIAVMTRKKEYAFLYGSGAVPTGSTGAEPLGLYNVTGVTKTSLANKTPTIDDLIKAEGRIEDANIEYGPSMAWVSHNRTRRTFKAMKDADGHPIFMESYAEGGVREMDLMGYDFVTSTQVPVSSNKTDIFLGEWESALIGQGQELEMIVDTSVLMRTRRTLIQIVDMVDFGIAYKEAFQILTNAKVMATT